MLPKLAPQDVYTRLQEGSVRIVDVREPDEYTRESINGSVLYPLSVAEKNPLPPSEKLTVFLCRSGRRTDGNAALLASRAGGNAGQLEGGLRAWVKAGLPVDRASKAPLPLQRQIQIGAGSIVLLGLLLHFIWPMALWLTALAGRMASALPSLLLSLFTALLATYLMSACRPELAGWAERLLPPPWRDTLGRLGRELKGALGGWLKAQLLLMLLTFGVLTAGLLLLRVEPALLLAGLIALLDALPLFGAAVILVPWAAGALLGGYPLLGAGLLVLCGVVILTRGLLEPRLVGGQVGLHPLAALAGLYVGFRLLGVAGMFLAPLFLVLVKGLWTCGIPGRHPPAP